MQCNLVQNWKFCNIKKYVFILRINKDYHYYCYYYYCICGDKFTVSHALSCKKGRFVAQRHDGVRNLLTTFIDKICNNVEIEPRLQPLDNERFHLRSAVTRQGWTSKREVSGQEELRHFLMLELRTSTPSVTRASQHRKCSKSKKKRRSASTSSGC